MAKSITEVLGIKYPIIQGGMAWISDAKLAAAVSNAGGAGIISCGGRTTEYVREEIRKAKQLTDKPFGVNVMLMAPNKDEIVDVICEEKPAFVTLGAGNPVPYFAKLKEAGIKVIPVIPNVKLAKRVAAAGADAMVAEGMEAGGHIGVLTTMALMTQVIPEIKDIPVVMAGGFGDGRGLAAAMLMGAGGVQMGTRFVTTEECDASDIFKQTYIEAKQEDIQIIKSPVGMPGRAIFSKFIQKVKEGQKQPKTCICKCIKTCDISKSPYCIIAALYNAFKGNMDNGYAFAGANAFRATKIVSVKETFRSLLDEFSRSGK